MSWKPISPVLVLVVVCPACMDVDETSVTERSDAGSILSDAYAPEDVRDASGTLTSSTGENAVPDDMCTEEEAPERTGEAAQADEGYPEVRNPWGDGAPDNHTYTGGPGGGGGGGYGGPAAPNNSGVVHHHHSSSEIEEMHEREKRYALATNTGNAIRHEFARNRSEARLGHRTRIGGGGTIDHNACVWTCDRAIAEACQGVQALCAGNQEIMLSPYVKIPCMSALVAACIVGKASSLVVCETMVCAEVQ